MNVLVGSTAGGVALAGLGLLIRNKRHHWYKFRGLIFLFAGLGLLPITWEWVQAGMALINKWGAALSQATEGVRWLNIAINAFVGGLPWLLGLVLTAWWLLDMWPKQGDPNDKTGFVGLFVPAAWSLLPPLAALIAVS